MRMEEDHKCSLEPLSFPSLFSLTHPLAPLHPTPDFPTFWQFCEWSQFLPASSGWLERRQTGIRVAAGAEPRSVPAVVPVDWEETASSCSMLFPLLAQGKPSYRRARGPAVLPLLARSPARRFGQGSCAMEL